MQNLIIYVRQDLNMRKGKMAAQVAHAVMKLLFDCTTKTHDKMILSLQQVQELENFLQNPQITISMVANEDSLYEILKKPIPYAIITDSGRTEFHGVPTVTCAAQGIFSQCRTSQIDVPHMYGKDIKAKQVFVFNKDFPLSKENSCKLSVLSCLTFLCSKLKTHGDTQYFDLTENNPFVAWISHAFAKIGLSTKTMEELNGIAITLKENNIHFIQSQIGENYCLCIEPLYPEKIDLITGNLKLI